MLIILNDSTTFWKTQQIIHSLNHNHHNNLSRLQSHVKSRSVRKHQDLSHCLHKLKIFNAGLLENF